MTSKVKFGLIFGVAGPVVATTFLITNRSNNSSQIEPTISAEQRKKEAVGKILKTQDKSKIEQVIRNSEGLGDGINWKPLS